MSILASLGSFFAGVSLLAVGGGNATLPAIQQHAIASGWTSAEEFLQIYALGQMAPGPSTMYVAGIGAHTAGWAGALVAGLAFVLPSSLLVVLVGTAWERWPDSALKRAMRTGLAPVTVALLVAGAWHLVTALDTLADETRHTAAVALALVLAITALVATLARWTRLPPALLVLGAGAVGFVLLA